MDISVLRNETDDCHLMTVYWRPGDHEWFCH